MFARATMLLGFVIIVIKSVLCLEDKKNLYFSYITTVTTEGVGLQAIGAQPLIDLALEEINNRTDILQDYTLGYSVIHDSKCDKSTSLASFFQDFPHDCPSDNGIGMMNNGVGFIAIIGCGCAIATSSVAEISHFWNVPQISFASSSNILSDRSRFKNLFVTLPSFQSLPTAIVTMFQQFKWRQMAIVTQHDPLFNQISMTLKKSFNHRNWTIYESKLSQELSRPTYRTFPFSKAFKWMMEKRDYRIIMINTFGDYAYFILCKAYELGLFPPKYTWITPTWFNEGWWISARERLGPSAHCPPSHIAHMLTGSIGITPHGLMPNENKSVVSFSKQTTPLLLEEYSRRLSLPQYVALEEVEVVGVAYDAIWSLALGLDKAVKKIQSGHISDCKQFQGDLVPLDRFNYSNAKLGCILRSSLHEVKFIGITGEVSYTSKGSRSSKVFNVQQYRENGDGELERRTFADIKIQSKNSQVLFTYKKRESEFTVWESGIPYDGSTRIDIHENSLVLGLIFYTLACVGIVFTLACFIFNVVFRNKKVVKLSSPNLNYLIIFGAAMLYVCVCLFMLPVSTANQATIICNIRLWIFSLSYTLCFAVILVKTWRIFYIFTNPTSKKKVVKDWALAVFILVIVACDLVILVIGTAIPGSRLTGGRQKDGEEYRIVSKDGVNEYHYVYVCITNDSVILLSFLFIYKGLLQVIAMFMAFNTRKVKIKALNESKETAAIIYINSIVLVLMTVSALLLETYHHTFAALFGLALFIQATLFLGLLFIPKAMILYKDPNSDNNVFSVSTQHAANKNGGIGINQHVLRRTSDNDTSAVVTNGNYNKTIEALRDKVKTLEGELREKSDEEKVVMQTV